MSRSTQLLANGLDDALPGEGESYPHARQFLARLLCVHRCRGGRHSDQEDEGLATLSLRPILSAPHARPPQKTALSP